MAIKGDFATLPDFRTNHNFVVRTFVALRSHLRRHFADATLIHIQGYRIMASTSLMLHCGAREVTREELARLPCPPPTKTWAPVGHARVLDTAVATLGEAGYTIEKTRLGVSRDDGRFFGTLDLSAPLTTDGTVTLAVGIRNSVDKTCVECAVMLS